MMKHLIKGLSAILLIWIFAGFWMIYEGNSESNQPDESNDFSNQVTQIKTANSHFHFDSSTKSTLY